MHLTSKAYAVLAIALIATAPALAATTPAVTASLVNAAKADLVPVAKLTSMVGVWSSADLGKFDKAKSIKVLDTRMLYQATDLKKIATVETSKASDLTKIRAAIRSDAGLDAWFASNKLDVNRVIAVLVPAAGVPEIVLY